MGYDAKWTPGEFEKNWLKRTLDMVVDGGIWVQSVGIFRLNKKTRTATFTPSSMAPLDKVMGITCEEMILRNRVVFKAIGWTVEDAKKETKNADE